MTMGIKRVGRLTQFVALPIIITVVIWFVTAHSTSQYFPPLSTVLSTMWSGLVSGNLTSLLLYSLRNLVVGLIIATVIGVGVGLLLGEHDSSRRILMPLLNFGRSTPQVAFVPIIIVTLGIGALPKILLIVLSSVWPILLNTINGVRAINPAVLETATCYRIPRPLRLMKVVLPGALPQILAGLRIAVAVGLLLVIVGELYGSATGIGYFIQESASNFDIVDTWAGTILIGIVGYVLSLLLLAAEHLLLGWHAQRPPRQRRAPRPAVLTDGVTA
jgi:ABC-type nitrate/sulfonate/bicarbonate transport system permease component